MRATTAVATGTRWISGARTAACVVGLGLGLVLPSGCRIAPNPETPGSGRVMGLGPDVAISLDEFRIVDLTHAFDAESPYWPTAPSGFELDTLAWGDTEGGWFYSAFGFAAPEHGGTHLDAPIHFHRGGTAVDEVELERLIGPAVVLDISAQAGGDPDYVLTVADVLAFEAEHGEIEEGSIVLLRTGWSRFWPDAARYLGDDTPGDASNLHFPSFGPEAARLLVEERGVAALGADVASIDPGASPDFPVHRIAGAAGVPGLENLTALGTLPPAGALVIALPMKIAGGSGAPLRAIALVRDAGR